MYKIIILALLFPICVFAQNEFRPGFIVNEKGDSLRGFVRYKVSRVATEKCSFKKSADGEVLSYLPGEINGYGFDGDKVFVVKDIDSTRSNTDLVFCEQLIRGVVNLYRYGDVFLIEKDKLYVLREEKSVVLDQNVSYEHKRKHFAGVLYFLFSDCIKSTNKIYASELREKDLVALTHEYNACRGAHVDEYKKDKAYTTHDWYVGGGMVNSVLNFRNDQNPFMSKPVTDLRAISPALGLGFQVTDPRTVENLYATMELYFTRHHFTEEYRRETPTSKSVENYDLTVSRVKIPLGLKYFLRSTSLSPYIRVGYTFDMFFKGNLKTKRVTSYSNDTQAQVKTDDGIGNFQIGQPWVAVGVQKKIGRSRFFIEIRGEGFGGKSNGGVTTKNGNIVVIDPKSLKCNTLDAFFGMAFEI